MTSTETPGHMADVAVARRQHLVAVGRNVPVLLARAQQLIANGADLTDPERFSDFVLDQVADAIGDTVIPGCSGGREVAAAVLVAELARRLAEQSR